MMTKEYLLEHANAKTLATIVARNWMSLTNEDAQESCLEEVYVSLASSVPEPENFALMSGEEKVQYEVDIDMLLITIDYADFEDKIFDKGVIEQHFWETVTCKDKKKNEEIYRVVFI